MPVRRGPGHRVPPDHVHCGRRIAAASPSVSAARAGDYHVIPNIRELAWGRGQGRVSGSALSLDGERQQRISWPAAPRSSRTLVPRVEPVGDRQRPGAGDRPTSHATTAVKPRLGMLVALGARQNPKALGGCAMSVVDDERGITLGRAACPFQDTAVTAVDRMPHDWPAGGYRDRAGGCALGCQLDRRSWWTVWNGGASGGQLGAAVPPRAGDSVSRRTVCARRWPRDACDSTHPASRRRHR